MIGGGMPPCGAGAFQGVAPRGGGTGHGSPCALGYGIANRPESATRAAIRSAATGSGRGALLGTTAKLGAIRASAGFAVLRPDLVAVDKETGEQLKCRVDRDGYLIPIREPEALRLERWALLSVVRDLMPNARTACCMRNRRAGHQVQVWRSVEYQRAHYRGLQTCASVWACPVCSAKISERRRAELMAAVAAHRAQGGVVLLVTLTVPHVFGDDLRGMVARMLQAAKRMRISRAGRAVMADVQGWVRALEVTHGENGWHPHFHELWFMPAGCSKRDIQAKVFELWRNAAVKSGFTPPSARHGVRIDDGSKAAAYASKWGLESELTQWHRKRGSESSDTPFDLLRRVLADAGDKEAGRLFREYAGAFFGRHQLQWSRGLKARFAVDDVGDAELVERADDDADLLGVVGLDDWRRVVKARLRGVLLEIAITGRWVAVQGLLWSLREAAIARLPGGQGGVPLG